MHRPNTHPQRLAPVAGAQGELENSIERAFSSVFQHEFSVADKTATSLNTITYIINYSKQLFSQNIDILQSYGKSWGISRFTIHWRCDDVNVKTRDGFTVKTE